MDDRNVESGLPLIINSFLTAKEFGLFLASEEDNKKGIWLEASRSLDYYMLRNGDVLEYNKKIRNLRVRMLDG
jgi:talin